MRWKLGLRGQPFQFRLLLLALHLLGIRVEHEFTCQGGSSLWLKWGKWASLGSGESLSLHYDEHDESEQWAAKARAKWGDD